MSSSASLWGSGPFSTSAGQLHQRNKTAAFPWQLPLPPAMFLWLCSMQCTLEMSTLGHFSVSPHILKPGPLPWHLVYLYMIMINFIIASPSILFLYVYITDDSLSAYLQAATHDCYIDQRKSHIEQQPQKKFPQGWLDIPELNFKKPSHSAVRAP